MELRHFSVTIYLCFQQVKISAKKLFANATSSRAVRGKSLLLDSLKEKRPHLISYFVTMLALDETSLMCWMKCLTADSSPSILMPSSTFIFPFSAPFGLLSCRHSPELLGRSPSASPWWEATHQRCQSPSPNTAEAGERAAGGSSKPEHEAKRVRKRWGERQWRRRERIKVLSYRIWNQKWRHFVGCWQFGLSDGSKVTEIRTETKRQTRYSKVL